MTVPVIGVLEGGGNKGTALAGAAFSINRVSRGLFNPGYTRASDYHNAIRPSPESPGTRQLRFVDFWLWISSSSLSSSD